ELRGLLDQAKQRLGSGIAAICAVNEGKAAFAVAVTDDLTGRFSAVDLVRAGVETLGGKGGGGRADMAQGGGPDGTKAADAIEAVRKALAGCRVRVVARQLADPVSPGPARPAGSHRGRAAHRPRSAPRRAAPANARASLASAGTLLESG